MTKEDIPRHKVNDYFKNHIEQNEEIKEMACNKIEETSRRMGERKVDPEVQKAIHNLIDKGIDREDINDEILEERLQSIMEKFEK